MLQNLFDPAAAAALRGRLDGLTPDAKPRWGRLTPPVVLCHLADPFRVALGEKQALLDVMSRFAGAPADQPLAPSPVFGRLSRRGWGRLMWRHLDHHLRQFGLYSVSTFVRATLLPVSP